MNGEDRDLEKSSQAVQLAALRVELRSIGKSLGEFKDEWVAERTELNKRIRELELLVAGMEWGATEKRHREEMGIKKITALIAVAAIVSSITSTLLSQALA